jgi:hypothetical protein
VVRYELSGGFGFTVEVFLSVMNYWETGWRHLYGSRYIYSTWLFLNLSSWPKLRVSSTLTPWDRVLEKLIVSQEIPRLLWDPEVKLSLCFNWAPRHEGKLGEWRYNFTPSLTSALDWGEWSASRPSRFTPRERASGTHWIGGWVGPRAVLDAVVKRKIPSPRRESNPRTPIVHPVAQHYTDWAV